MINDFDIYKKIYNFSNYMIYLNTKLIGNFISLGYNHLDFKQNIGSVKIMKYINQNYKKM